MSRYDRDEALTMADFNEVPMTHDQIRARNLRWEVARAKRVARGLPPFKTVARQQRRDSNRYPVVDTMRPDPILDLYVARESARLKPCDPFTQQRYGEIRQRVTSPVHLPGMKP